MSDPVMSSPHTLDSLACAKSPQCGAPELGNVRDWNALQSCSRNEARAEKPHSNTTGADSSFQVDRLLFRGEDEKMVTNSSVHSKAV